MVITGSYCVFKGTSRVSETHSDNNLVKEKDEVIASLNLEIEDLNQQVRIVFLFNNNNNNNIVFYLTSKSCRNC